MGLLMRCILGLLRRKITRLARKRGIEYSFLFVRPDVKQLIEMGRLLELGTIHPVIDNTSLYSCQVAQDLPTSNGDRSRLGSLLCRLILGEVSLEIQEQSTAAVRR